MKKMPSKTVSQDVTDLRYQNTAELQTAVDVAKLRNTILGYAKVLQTGDKLYDNASLAFKDGDEELAYVLYMRTIEIYQNAKKCRDYKDSSDRKHWSSMCGNKIKDALTKSETIFASLERKYSLKKEINDVQQKEKAELEELQENQKKFGRLKDDSQFGAVKTNNSVADLPVPCFEAGMIATEKFINCDKLYNLLYGGDSILILDIRPEDEFNESHIRSDHILNIPEDLFISGTTASKIESQLKTVSNRILFRKRHDAKYVILVNWQSTVDDIERKGKSLRVLFDALYQFDNVQLKRAPVVLEGGYKMFLLCYPTWTTNGAFIRREVAGADCATEGKDSSVSQESWYPDLTTLSSIAQQQSRTNIVEQQVVVESNKYVRRYLQQQPTIDRSLKPKTLMPKPTNHVTDITVKEPRKRSISPPVIVNDSDDVRYSELNQAIVISKHEDMKSHLDGIKQKISDASRAASEIGASNDAVKDDTSVSDALPTSSIETSETEKHLLTEKQRRTELILEAKTERIDRLSQQLEQLRALKPKYLANATGVAPSPSSASANVLDSSNVVASNEAMEQLEFELKKLTTERDAVLKENADLTAKLAERNEELARKNDLERLRKERKLQEKTKKPTSNEVEFENDKIDPNLRKHVVEDDEGNTQSSTSGKDASSPSAEDVSGSLRRAQSSPNIAKIVAQEQTVPSNTPTFDRNKKPLNQSEEMTRQETEFFQKAFDSLRTIYGDVKRGLTGLRNLGSTCYMNSTIQCLSNTEPLRDYFITQRYRRDINYTNKLGFKGEVARNFAVLLHSLWSGTNKVVIPYEFKKVAGMLGLQFNNYLQQDAQEFANYLLDGLHEDLNKIKSREPIEELNSVNVDLPIAADRAWQNYLKLNNSIIVDLFQGQFLNVVQCQTCKTKSSVFDPVLFLTLPLPPENETLKCPLERCIKGLLEPEFMTGDSKWDCPKCKCKRDAMKWFRMWKLPKVLIICLKRFQGYGRWHQKLRTMVDFPVNSTLTLSPGCCNAGLPSFTTYRLHGVVNHYGTMEGGHYTAYCRNGGSWFEFDDDKVSEISDKSIASQSAYLLFYMAFE